MKLNQLEVGKTYSAQFSNKPLMKLISVVDNQCEFEVFRNDGTTVVRKNNDNFTTEMLCYRIYDPDIKSIPYEGKITKDDIICMQECFDITITEQMIRDAISANNWGGDYTSNLNKYGIDGDSDNRDSVVEMIKNYFSLKYNWE